MDWMDFLTPVIHGFPLAAMKYPLAIDDTCLKGEKKRKEEKKNRKTKQ
jgi:hypothetical protein